MLFAAGLYEKGIRCHAPPWFIVLHGPAVGNFALNRIVLHLHVCLILVVGGREEEERKGLVIIYIEGGLGKIVGVSLIK